MMDYLMSNYIIILFISVIGLCLGSFYNVVILRSLSNESIVFPGSKCPKCGEKLKPWHNIPVLSYIFLRGKCAFCKEKISLQYPLVELTTMGLFLWSFYEFGFSYKTLLAIVVLSSLLIMTVTDLKEKVLDCNIAIGMGVFGILYHIFITHSVINSLLGLACAILIIESIARLGYLFTKSRALGEGDTYVAGAIGACFCLKGLIFTLIVSVIASMLIIIPIFLKKQFENNRKDIAITLLFFIIISVCYGYGYQNIFTFILLTISGILSAILILKSLKDEKTTPMYLPYVPALAIGATYVLFFGRICLC